MCPAIEDNANMKTVFINYSNDAKPLCLFFLNFILISCKQTMKGILWRLIKTPYILRSEAVYIVQVKTQILDHSF